MDNAKPVARLQAAAAVVLLTMTLLALLLAPASSARAQDDDQDEWDLYQRDFPPEEFTQRRGQVFDKIGNRALAVLQGAPRIRGFGLFRQSREFYYLCGVEVPQAHLVLDGTERKTALYLPRLDADAERVIELTGVDAVYDLESLAGHLKGISADVLYTPFGPARRPPGSRDGSRRNNRPVVEHLWDEPPPREQWFIDRLNARLPGREIRDLTPIIDQLRAIKSPREIVLLRRAGQLSGLALREAMRSTQPGMMEYQLDAAARYVFRVNGARGVGYPSITAAGAANYWHGHYQRNNSMLKDGDLVLMDFAPDCGYYTSDIGRMWPVNGKYTPQQRELYGFMVKYHQAVIKRIRPGVTTEAIMRQARAEMDEVLSNTKFSKPIYEKAARSTYGHLSHPVGMSVHDVGDYRRGPLRPGMVFAVDPQMRVREEKLYIRIEDTVVVTRGGVEVLTAAAPWELDEVERLIREDGILQERPPTPPRDAGKTQRNLMSQQRPT